MATTFKLVETTKEGKENYYHYASDKGVKVAFHAHPTEAWCWVILEGERKVANKVIKAVLETCFDKTKMQTISVK